MSSTELSRPSPAVVVQGPVDPYALISRPDGLWILQQAIAEARFRSLLAQIRRQITKPAVMSRPTLLVIQASCMASAVPEGVLFSPAVVAAFKGNVKFSRNDGGKVATITGVEPVRVERSFNLGPLAKIDWRRTFQLATQFAEQSLADESHRQNKRKVTQPSFSWSIAV